MDFANLTDDLLDALDIVTTDEGEPDTLRNQLEKLVDEDIIEADWTYKTYGQEKHLVSFYAWTESYVLFIIYGTFNERYVTKIPRNPSTKRISHEN